MGLLTIGYLIVGFLLLVSGAELLVKGAARLAEILGVPPLIIGLTVVALATSAPETAVSLEAVRQGSGDLSLGNVVGSNIANVLLILGLCALIAPLVVSRQLVRVDVPVLIAAGLAVFAMAWNGHLGRGEGLVLLLALCTYTVLLVRAALRERPCPPGAHVATDGRGPARSAARAALPIALVVTGLALLVGGSHLLVEGARRLAAALGLSELVIGLTVLALGTSLPELATSLLAVTRGQRDLAVGNVVGSCIFNLLLVLGSAAVASPTGLSVSPNALAFDLPVMLAVFVACLPIFFSGYRINRWEGLLFFGYYLAYTLYLVLFATGLPALSLFRQAMGWFVLPLTTITLSVIGWRSVRHARSPRKELDP